MELKFRAWDHVNNEMLFADFGEIQDIGGEWTAWELPPDSPTNTGTAFDVMQFIGFQDVNGNDIYEGDILHQLDPVIWNPFTVEYSDQSASYIAGGLISKITIKENELVIIGNIHQENKAANNDM